jgi:hypothetical protein
MVAYLHLLPILGLLVIETAHANALSLRNDEPQTGVNWGYVPGAYIVEYEDGHVS